MAAPGALPLFTFGLLWLQNFLLIFILAIVFGIKEDRSDAFYQLVTYLVAWVIKNTLYKIVFPLLLLNLVVFLVDLMQGQPGLSQTIFQAIPY